MTVFLGTKARGDNAKSGARAGRHRTAARITYVTLILFVVLVETAVRFKGGARHDKLFLFHLAWAMPTFVGMTLLNSVLSGAQSRGHAALAYVTTAMFVGTAITGAVLIWTRF